jgi:hypothetical protein
MNPYPKLAEEMPAAKMGKISKISAETARACVITNEKAPQYAGLVVLVGYSSIFLC